MTYDNVRFREEAIRINEYATAGDGSVDRPWTGWETALLNIPSTGDVYVFSPGHYTQNLAIALPVGVTRQLVISGYGATIKLTTAAPRLFDINRTADYQTFQNVIIEGMTVDADNIGGQHHVILGTYKAGATGSGDRLHMADILLRNVTTKNVLTGTDTNANDRRNVVLDPRQTPGPGQTQVVARRILIERLVLNGGVYGVSIAGQRIGGTDPDVNVLFDAITIRNSYHDTGVTPTVGLVSANFHVVNRGIGGSILIDNCIGINSGDVGIEVDSVDRATIRDCYIQDAFNAAYLKQAFSDSSTASSTGGGGVVEYENCRAARINFVPTLSTQGAAFKITDDNVNGHRTRRVALSRCSVYRSTPELITDGDAIFVDTHSISGTTLDELVVRDFSYRNDSVLVSSGSPVTRHILISMRGTGHVLMDGVQFHIRGDCTGATPIRELIQIFGGAASSGPLTFDLNNIWMDDAVTSGGPGNLRGLDLGSASVTGWLAGTVRNLHIKSLGDGTNNAKTINVRDTGTTTFVSPVRFYDADFSGRSANGQDIVFTGDNADKIYLYGTRWRTFPITSTTISPGASPYAYQNLDGYAETVTVSGGTVSAIDLSVEGVTYRSAGVTAGAWLIQPADFLKVTYSSVPVMTKLPVR